MIEGVFYSVVRLETYQASAHISSGTGFLYAAELNDGYIPVIFTNKHVFENCNKLHIKMHIINKNETEPTGHQHEFIININSQILINHPDADVDLCCIPLRALESQIPSGKRVFHGMLSRKNIPSDSEWENFDALEEILMIGCPNGLYDNINGIPIARKGITATPLFRNYNGRREFVIDMACFPGSSGSPIAVWNQLGYYNKITNVTTMRSRFFLIGVLYAGPLINQSGVISMHKQQDFKFSTMMHLGYAIKAERILEMDKILCDIAKNQSF